MPLVTVHTSADPPPEEKAAAFLRELSAAMARELKKPEAYMMTCLAPKAPMTFGGSPRPACAVEVRSIGNLSAESARRVSDVACTLVAAHLGVPKDRTFVVCADVPAHLWGHDGSTFG